MNPQLLTLNFVYRSTETSEMAKFTSNMWTPVYRQAVNTERTLCIVVRTDFESCIILAYILSTPYLDIVIIYLQCVVPYTTENVTGRILPLYIFFVY